MAALSDYLENKIIDHLRNVATFTAPATWHVALLSSAPSDTGGGVEVTGGSYARVAYTASGANLAGTQAAGSTTASTGSTATTSNNSAITFATPTANWGVVTHMAVFDASSAGNLLFYATLAAPKTINSGDAAPSFAAGTLGLQIDS